MNTPLIIFIVIYFLLFSFYIYTLFQAKIHINLKEEKFTKLIKNKQIWLKIAMSLFLFTIAALVLFIPIGSATQWFFETKTIVLEKEGQDVFIKLDPKKEYIDLAYDKNGTLYGIFWDFAKKTFFLEELSPKERKKSVALEKMPAIFSESSNFSHLPIFSDFPNNEKVKVRTTWHQTQKKIKINWENEKEKIVPKKLEEESLLGYSLGNEMIFISYMPEGSIFNRIFIYEKDFVEKPLLHQKRIGHFYSPYYWSAKKALFFMGIERKKKENNETVFISKLFVKEFENKEKENKLLEIPLTESKILHTFTTKVAGSADGHFFMHHAITEESILIFYWIKTPNLPFVVEWESLKKVLSFALSPKIKKEHYKVSLLGETASGEKMAVTSVLKPQKNITNEKNIIKILLLITCTIFGSSLYIAGVALNKKKMIKTI